MSSYWSAFRNWLKRQELLPPPERAGRLAFFAASGFLIYVYGVISSDFRLFPYGAFQRAYAAFAMLVSGPGETGAQEFLYYPQRSEARGVTRLDREKAAPGYTALSYFNSDRLFLIDAQGRVLHSWKPRLSTDERDGLDRLFASHSRKMDRIRHLHLLKFHIFENGDAILMLYGAGGRWPIGFGLVKVDRDSNVLWKHIDGRTHHDFDVAPDGRIFVLSSRFLTEPQEGMESLPLPYISNGVTVLDRDGGKIDEIDLVEAIRDSPYDFLNRSANMLSVDRYDQRNDHIHANDIDVLTPQTARNFRFGEAGDVVVSMRNIHAIGTLNIERRVFTWLTRGPWIAQHDPDILPGGNILVYDNSGSDRPGGRSRILEFDPGTMEIVWSYEGTQAAPFDSDIRGSQQRLANGNVLISEAVAGRVFEVTPAGEIVWELHSPFRAGADESLVPTVRWPERIAPDYFTPEFRARLEKAAETALPLGSGQAGQAVQSALD